jgi:MFS transporter, OPA family, glycerol-3-phosphate transporter
MPDFPLISATTEQDRDVRFWQLRIFWLLWAAYASYYLCRVNFSVAQPEILREFPDWTAARIGTIPSVYAACYAAGQLINGQIGQRFGARLMMTAAMVVAGVSNLLFSTAHTFGFMLVLWAINGLAQSAGWSLLIQTITNWTAVARRGTVIGLLATCYTVGNVASWLLAGELCDVVGWRAAFWVPPLIVLPLALVFALLLRNTPQEAGFRAIRDDVAPAPEVSVGPSTADGIPALRVLLLTFSNRILWILGIGYFCMNAVRYTFMNWAVQYLADFHGRSVKGSAFMAVTLPLIGAVGSVSAGFVSDRLFGRRRAPVCAISLFALALVCLLFVKIPQGQWQLATAMLGLAGFLLYGPDTLMSGAATVDVHPKGAAAATGFTMCLGASGAIFSGAGVGWLKDLSSGSWTAIFQVLAALSVLSALLMVSIWNVRPKGARA